MSMYGRAIQFARSTGLPIAFPDDPRFYHYFECDFEPSTAAVFGWNQSATGGASQETEATVNHPGTNIVYSSGSATGFCSIRRGSQSILFGGGWCLSEWTWRIPTLATAAQDFSNWIGFQDATTTAGPVDGCGAKVSRTGGLEYFTRSNSTESTVASGVTIAAATWYRTLAVANDTGTVAYFRTNGEGAGSLSTNIPVGAGRATALGACLITSAGTGTHTLEVDITRSLSVFNTQRTL